MHPDSESLLSDVITCTEYSLVLNVTQFFVSILPKAVN